MSADPLRPTREDFARAFLEAGLESGQTVYVAASLAALGMMDHPEETIMGALWDVLGPRGTVVMPAFNFGFCQEEPFDLEKTPAHTGALAEWFRTQDGTLRTWAPPFHSLAAAGPEASRLTEAESASSFGPASAFTRLVEEGAYHLLIGCGFHEGVAHVHWLEEQLAVPYRYWKKFEGDIIRNGARSRHAFFMMARQQDARLDAEPLGRDFADTAAIKSSVAGLCRIRGFAVRDFTRYGRARLEADPRLLIAASEAESGGQASSSAEGLILGVDHIGVVSPYADRIETLLKHAGLKLTFEGRVPDLDLTCRYFDAGNCHIEIVNPDSEDSVVAAHAKRYPHAPLHHVALRVRDLAAAVAYFGERGYVQLDGRVHLAPAPGDRVCFLSPLFTGGLLLELVARGEDDRLTYDPRWPAV
jgi:aminoglycoside 3-N-acetyltransferase